MGRAGARKRHYHEDSRYRGIVEAQRQDDLRERRRAAATNVDLNYLGVPDDRFHAAVRKFRSLQDSIARDAGEYWEEGTFDYEYPDYWELMQPILQENLVELSLAADEYIFN